MSSERAVSVNPFSHPLRFLTRVVQKRYERRYGSLILPDYEFSYSSIPSLPALDVHEPDVDTPPAVPILENAILPPLWTPQPPTLLPLDGPHSGQARRSFRRRQNRRPFRSLQVVERAQVTNLSLSTLSLPHQSTSYLGVNSRSSLLHGRVNLVGSIEDRLEFLDELGWFYIPAPEGYDMILVDKNGRIFATILGSNESKDIMAQQIYEQTLILQHQCTGFTQTRRGLFDTISYGFSHGMGRAIPSSFANSKNDRLHLEDFLSSTLLTNHFRMLNDAWQLWQPRVHHHYRHMMSQLTSHYNHLLTPSPHIPFPAITINVGPVTQTIRHLDSANFVPGQCFVKSGGSYNHRREGHVVLHEPKVVVELAPGNEILFPSACISHENIPVEEGNIRISQTGYASGDLFRHLDNGLAPSIRKPKTAKLRREQTIAGERRWIDAWQLYSRVDELKEIYNPAVVRYWDGGDQGALVY